MFKKIIALALVLVLAAACFAGCGSKEVTVESIQKAGKLDEAFGTGTAAVISPIGELNDNGEIYTVNEGKIGSIAQKLYDNLYGMQTGVVEDDMGWTYPLGF